VDADQQWRKCPDVVVIEGDDGSVTLRKRSDSYAIRGPVPDELRAGVLETLPGDDITIIRGTPRADSVAQGQLLPVYRGDSGEDLAVVTGRIFLRLDEGREAAGATERVASMGLRVAEILPYAPNAAWLEPASGKVADGLARLDELRALPGVAHVEPQILRPRAWKSGR
jgi:hypothetical protein